MGGSELLLEHTLQVALFLAATWAGGRIMRGLNASPIVGEMLAGVLLGPHVLKLAPYSTDSDDGFPSVFVLAGNVRELHWCYHRHCVGDVCCSRPR